MQRRGFLSAILAAGVAPAYVGARVLMPVRRVIAAPKVYSSAELAHGFELSEANRLITIEQLTREAIAIIERQYADATIFGSAWAEWRHEKDRIVVRRCDPVLT